MVRVPLPFRGIAVLLLAASTVAGQTPEPPEVFPLDPYSSPSPDLLRQFSNDSHHPLLQMMVDGELTAFEVSPSQQESKTSPTQQKSSSSASSKAAPQTQLPASSTNAPSDGSVLEGCGSEGVVLEGCGAEGWPLQSECAQAPTMFPYACCPPPCCCRKCQHKCRHKHCHSCGSGGGYCGGYGQGCDNPYLGWPSCPEWCSYSAPCVPYQQCCGHKCHRHRCRHCCGGNYGGCDYGCGCPAFLCPGYNVDCAPSCCGHKCHRCRHKHCCGNQGCGYGYGCGYEGWGGSGYDGCMNSYCGSGCGKHHRHRGCGHRCHGCQMPAPCPYFPCSMPCMGDGMMSGMGGGMMSGMGGGMMSGMGGGMMSGMDGGMMSGMGGGMMSGMGGESFGGNFAFDGGMGESYGMDGMNN